DDAFRIGDDASVVEKHVDVIFRGQQSTDVAFQNEVGPVCALDRLGDLWIGGMNQRTHFAADALLPHGQSIDVGVNAWMGCSGHGSTINPERLQAAASAATGSTPRRRAQESQAQFWEFSSPPTMDGLAHSVDRYLSRRVLPRGGPAALG